MHLKGNNMKDLRILITGVGSLSANSVLRSYKIVKERNIYIVGTDIKEVVPNQFIDKYYQNKKPTEKGFIKNLIDICKKEKIDFLIPLVDSELEILSKNKELFSNVGTEVCLNDAEKLNIIQDKYRLYKYLEEHNIAVPKTVRFNSKEEFIEGCRILGYPKETICYKPLVSSGSRGFRIIDSNIDYESNLFREKPNSKYVNYDFVVNAMQNCSDIPNMMLMEYLSGDFFNVGALAKDGETLYLVVSHDTSIELGNLFEGKVVENNDVNDYCKKVIKLLGLSGNVGLQLAYSKDKKLKLIEINPRINGSVFQSCIEGFNMPYYELKYRLKESIPKPGKPKKARLMRYLEDCYIDEDGTKLDIDNFFI